MPFGLELIIQILLAIHAARTGRLQPWLYIILFLPGIGPLLYVVIELGPELLRGRTGRRVQTGLVNVVAPGRDYRALARQVEIAPTVLNKLRLAEECLRLGRAPEAVALYEACATGLHADDPGIRLGLARARLESGDAAGAVADLETLARDTPEQRTADGHLLYARALDGAGQTQAALDEYAALVDYFPGEEARCRYADLLTRIGAPDQARVQYGEIVRRTELQGGPYRRMQRLWYDTARRAMI